MAQWLCCHQAYRIVAVAFNWIDTNRAITSANAQDMYLHLRSRLYYLHGEGVQQRPSIQEVQTIRMLVSSTLFGVFVLILRYALNRRQHRMLVLRAFCPYHSAQDQSSACFSVLYSTIITTWCICYVQRSIRFHTRHFLPSSAFYSPRYITGWSLETFQRNPFTASISVVALLPYTSQIYSNSGPSRTIQNLHTPCQTLP